MGRSLRIVHCFRSPVGGIFRHVRDLARAQSSAGHLVGIVCDSSTGGDYEAKLFEQISETLALGVHRTPMQRHVGPGDIAAAFRTYRLIKQLQPDILHGHGAKGGVYSRLFGSLLRVSRSRVARLYSPHGGSLHYDGSALTGKAIFAAERLMDRFTDHLFFVSRYEERVFSQKIGTPHASYSLVYNGLGDAEFIPVLPAPDAADFLYIGMMRDLKGPDIFIDAIALTEKALGRPLTAVMVGDGDGLPAYRERIAGLGIGDRVAFHPPMPARQAFALARAIVVPSRAEAMPYIVLEALAAGMPMIATSVGGIPEIFPKDSPALSPPDAGEISARMAKLLADPAAWRGLMPTESELKGKFGVEVMAGAIEREYFRALER